MERSLDRLPAHERRRLRAVPGADPEELAARRLAGEPLQYLEGTAPFTDFDVAVDPRVLVPRPETEGLVELAAHAVESPEVIVDLGTGSGVIAIALARRFPRADVHAVESDPAALAVAGHNVSDLAPGISLHLGELFDPLPVDLEGRVELVVSNPPYVSEAEWDSLPDDVRREPRRALVAGREGTEVLEAIAAGVGRWLRPGGVVACEIGETQEAAVRRLFAAVGSVEVARDLAGRIRYVVAARTT